MGKLSLKAEKHKLANGMKMERKLEYYHIIIFLERT